jgi:hypothetical protein
MKKSFAFVAGGLLALAVVASLLSAAATRATISGKVTDSSGKPLDNATVMIYHAGVRKGYNAFCPSCYVDCGKRVITDRAGSFSFKSLDPDLWFELLVIRDGYTATFVDKVDPAQGTVATAALTRRLPVNDPGRIVRGRVVDPAGQPLRAAVVMPLGLNTEQGSMYGTIEGLEPIAVTNAQGEFELANSQGTTGILLQVEVRAMASKMVAVATGADRKTITVSSGAVVRGRLINRGRPVAGAEMGLIARERGGFGANLKIIGNPYDEIRIGTQQDGTFVITNVPAPVDWYVYGKMESIAALGATQPSEFSTRRDKEEVNVGDIEIRPGYRLGGKVELSDGAVIADGMRITIGAKDVWDSQTVMIGRDGRFGFFGIPAGKYEISPSVRGYRLQDKDLIDTTVNRDIDDLTITLAPAARR